MSFITIDEPFRFVGPLFLFAIFFPLNHLFTQLNCTHEWLIEGSTTSTKKNNLHYNASRMQSNLLQFF